VNVHYVKSSFCPAGACVEAGILNNGDVAVIDGKDRGKGPYVFTAQEWVAFVRGVKNDEFDFGLPGL
jgi:hypothetical protein